MNKITLGFFCFLLTTIVFAQESIVTTSKNITKNSLNARESVVVPAHKSMTKSSTTTSAPNVTKESNNLNSDDSHVTTTLEYLDGSPCFIVKNTSDKVLNAVDNGVSHRQIMSLIKNVVTPQFDFSLMTKYALGNNWKLATSDQQTQLVETFKQLLVFTYSTALSKFKGAKIVINNEIINTNNNISKATVVSLVNLPNSPNNAQPIKVEYDLAQTGENKTWKAYDIKIENASLVTTYRNQFNDIIVSSNVEGLIKQLKTKVATLQKSKM